MPACLRLAAPRHVNRTVAPRRPANGAQRRGRVPGEGRAAAATATGRDAHRHGLRASEIADLEWSQVELGHATTLHVRRAKNGKSSAHPLCGDEVRAPRELCRQFPDSALVFATERGGPFTVDAINRHLKRIGERAGLPTVHLHMLRHGCGYALVRVGYDTGAIQDWLGHRSVQHTVRCTELSPTRIRDFWRN
jgi:type 1 fimbriae regulatory protein FimB/type 1 fimbriae regulatory protein FimE